MLNEIIALERGLVAAGFDVAPRHPDLSSPGRTEALRVRLDMAGQPVEVAGLERNRVAALWTLRNGKHNSFPYVQLKQPLLSVPEDAGWREAQAKVWKAAANPARRQLLRDLVRDHPMRALAPFGPGLRESLGRRLAALGSLGPQQAAVPAVIGRVLALNDGGIALLRSLVDRLMFSLDEADDALLEMARAALMGRAGQSQVVGVPLYFDVARDEFERDVADPSHAGPISAALSGGAAGSGATGTCLLTGQEARLHAGNFPQPSLPVLGQVYLFSKNGDIPAAARYGRADADGLPVGAELSQRLAGALDAITTADHRGWAWQSVPGERPKSADLLIALVKGVPEAPAAGVVAGGEEEVDDLDPAEAARRVAAQARGAFLTRTERLMRAVEDKVGADFRRTPVDLLVLRKVDTGNAKAIVHRALTVDALHAAATAWAAALDNLPERLALPVPAKDRRVRWRRPPALAPLDLPRATRALFLRGGSERAKREPVGLPAADALALFLGEAGSGRIARAALTLVLARQGGLLAGAAHALRQDAGSTGFEYARDFDRAEALRSAALVGLLLAKMGRMREDYMNDAAFRLGQLLAAADTLHVGWCMDMRGGDVPPSLLGNSVLAIAQTDPVRALDVLCRRWKPYGGWAKGSGARDKAETLKNPKEGSEAERKQVQQRGWAIIRALSQARRADEVARALHGNLPDARDVDDRFRAELLLGYVAGLPKAEPSGGPQDGVDGSVEDQAEVLE